MIVYKIDHSSAVGKTISSWKNNQYGTNELATITPMTLQ